MRKLCWLILVLFFLGACGVNNSGSNDRNSEESDSQSSERLESKKAEGENKMKKPLIVYYSLTENTKEVAEEIQKQTDGGLLRIETAEPYPEAYDDVLEIVRTQRSDNELPEIVSKEVNLSDYDRIFLGAPIWFGEPALPVEKWLSENDLTGKKIYPFFTSGSSSINESMDRYKGVLTQSTLSEGLGITSSDKNETSKLVQEWLEQLD
ncbi:hypothetical protein IGI50_003773 [Enterococcus sp. DIV0170]